VNRASRFVPEDAALHSVSVKGEPPVDQFVDVVLLVLHPPEVLVLVARISAALPLEIWSKDPATSNMATNGAVYAPCNEL